MSFLFIDNEKLLKWSLVATKMRCSGEKLGNTFWKARHLKDCAKSCVGVSSMFIYERKEVSNRCRGDGCECLCETTASPDGTCRMDMYDGYNLYRFDSGNT